jgi:hypothetical protein
MVRWMHLPAVLRQRVHRSVQPIAPVPSRMPGQFVLSRYWLDTEPRFMTSTRN